MSTISASQIVFGSEHAFQADRVMRAWAPIGLALLLAGCLGVNHNYRSDAEFGAYIAKLHLETLSLDAAVAVVTRDGFKCAAEGVRWKCERIYSAYGNQWQWVILSSDPAHPDRTIVEILPLANLYI
jgi:hypothetical protein